MGDCSIRVKTALLKNIINLLKDSHSSCKKGCGQVWQPYTRWPGWKVMKSRWRPRNGCDDRSMAKFLNNNNSGEFCADSYIMKLGWGHKWTWIVVIKIFCHRSTITAISWLPIGFHNFFTLAILYRAARLGRTLFYSLNGCLWVYILCFKI